MRNISCLTIPLVIVSAALAGPVELTVDETQSGAAVELCLTLTATACDTDTTPIGGSVTLALDCLAAPSELTLHDFAFRLLEQIDLDLDFGYGQFFAAGTGIEVHYADPGHPMSPVAVTGNVFSVAGVPARATGQLAYQATGFACTLFYLSGYPCQAVIDLGTLALNPLDIEGALAASHPYLALAVVTVVSGPVDPDNPALGTMNIGATMLASGLIPPPCCLGDLSGDDRVDLGDHGRFLGCLAGPAEPAAAPCPCADLDGDDDVDLADWAEFQVRFQGS